VDFTIANKENMRARAFGDATFVIKHQRIIPTGGLSFIFGERADHIETGRFRFTRGGAWVRANPIGNTKTNAFHLVFKIAAPMPSGDAEVDFIIL